MYTIQMLQLCMHYAMCTLYMYVCMFVCMYAKQKHLGCKKVRGQSEATLLTGMCYQKL